jgi:hypothetical protein
MTTKSAIPTFGLFFVEWKHRTYGQDGSLPRRTSLERASALAEEFRRNNPNFKTRIRWVPNLSEDGKSQSRYLTHWE